MSLVLIPFFMFLIYLFIRSYLFDIRKVESSAYIDRISLCYFNKKMVLPEALVTYKYYFRDGVYYNSTYIPLVYFLQDPYYYIYLDNDDFAVLETFEKVIFSEERIEDYILKKSNSLLIYFDPVEPYNSKIKDESFILESKSEVYA